MNQHDDLSLYYLVDLIDHEIQLIKTTESLLK